MGGKKGLACLAVVKTSNKQVKGWVGDWFIRVVVEWASRALALEKKVADKALNALLECWS